MTILVNDLAPKTLEVLKRKAKQNGRSLNAEICTVLGEAASRQTRQETFDRFEELRHRLSKAGRTFDDSTEIIREMRDSR